MHYATFILTRIYTDESGTISVLTCPELGGFKCFAIEDPHAAKKVEGNSRIPAGIFDMRKIFDSPLTKRHQEKWGIPYLFEIEDVPNFTAIRIHVGNGREHTEGCPLLVDRVTVSDRVYGFKSVYTMRRFVEYVRKLEAKHPDLAFRLVVANQDI